MEGRREHWIDCLKVIAILAVLVDHTKGILYTNEMIRFASYYSVSLFVILGGITGYQSNKKHIKEPYVKNVVRQIGSLIVPYAVATAVYLFYNNKSLNLKEYLLALGNFTASGPFYFVLFYVQLLVISRFLYLVVEVTGKSPYAKILYIIEVVVSIVCSWFFIKYTYVLPVHGGGQFLFGGTYFTLYFLGMLLSGPMVKRGGQQLLNLKVNLLVSMVLFIATVAWFLFIYHDQCQIDLILSRKLGYHNPPGISFSLYALLVLMFFWSVFRILKFLDNGFVNILIRVLGYIGKYSIYIFLYHKLLLAMIRRLIGLSENVGMDIFIYFGGMIGGCVLIGVLSKKSFRGIKKLYQKAVENG